LATDVFVSYKKEDRERVREIVLCLRHAGVGVWWDQDIEAGASWDDAIAGGLNGAKCVVVVWSQLSVVAPWVKEEAGHGKARGVLAPVRIDDVEPPIGFTLLQTADLRNWKGDPDERNFTAFVNTVRKIVRGERVDTLSAPFLKRRRNWVMGISLVAVGLLAIGALAFSILRDPVAVIDQPSAEEQAAWESALGLRTRAGYGAYLVAFPEGYFKPEANAKLATCRVTESVRYVSWQPRTDAVQGSSGFFTAREDAAADADERARESAEYYCNSVAREARAQDVRTSTQSQGYSVSCTHMDLSDTYTCNKTLFVTCTGRRAIRSSGETCE
jgi:hypothetical protein